MLAAGVRQASRAVPQLYAVLLETDEVRLRLAAVDDDPPAPWRADDAGLSWSAPRSALESTRVEAEADASRRLVTLGVDDGTTVFLDLGQADGLIGLTGEPGPLRALVTAWTAELAGRPQPGAGRVLLVGVEPPAALAAAPGAVAQLPTVRDALTEASRVTGTAAATADDWVPDPAPAGVRAQPGTLVLACAPDEHELAELQALTCRPGSGWAVVVLGGCDGARWHLTLQRDGQLSTGTLGLMSSPEEPAPAASHAGPVRPAPSTPTAAGIDPVRGRDAGAPPRRWPVLAAVAVAAVVTVVAVVVVYPRTSLWHGTDKIAAAGATTPVNLPRASGNSHDRSGGAVHAGSGAGTATSAPGRVPAPGAVPRATRSSGAGTAPAAVDPRASRTAPAGGTAPTTGRGPVPTQVATGPTGPIIGKDGKCIGPVNGKTVSGTPIDVYSCVGDPTQTWTVMGDGTIRNSGMCLDVSEGRTDDGTMVQIHTCNNTAAEQWVYSSGRDLVNPRANKCLDMKSNSSADYSRLQIWTCNGGANQKWTIPD